MAYTPSNNVTFTESDYTPSNNVTFTESEGVTDNTIVLLENNPKAVILDDKPFGDISLLESRPDAAISANDPFGVINLVEPLPNAVIYANISAGIINLIEPLPSLSILGVAYFAKKTISKRLWTLIIRGIDAYPDIEIPISSLQESLNFPKKASYSCTVPDGTTHAADIAARANSSFYIVSTEVYADGTQRSVQAIEADITSIRADRGGRNYSITIQGSSEFSNDIPKRLMVKGVSYHSITDGGGQSLRAENDMDFLGGDTAVLLDGTEFTVGVVTRLISANIQTMQLTEAKNG